MNINAFFILIFIGLIMIYVGFKPLNIAKQDFKDVPLFELESFVLHELNQEKLITIMKGSKAKRFADKYRVIDIDYTDNSKELLANIRSDIGLYRDKKDIINLVGNVIYNREDGLVFESQEAIYNKKEAIAETQKDYIMYREKNEIIGTSLVYNNTNGKVKSKNVIAIYQIKER
ncbi:MAG: LPS export ABC transporter periplasmic protein LptC [Sulfurimonas sp.]|uniref:LPS export ABC transporter periplasmic protein LptC n=1 Tax=Sulfurimonas sp. TaxID=2022749 RepID=UPI0025FE6A44|nr:LPS export ABC transporter periplasmic protein LptC [Sulfurimonas sp.]MCK9491750.1 LPS export ABC transporter periplasmic protein LptC [Sulfurimonas sp.]